MSNRGQLATKGESVCQRLFQCTIISLCCCIHFFPSTIEHPPFLALQKAKNYIHPCILSFSQSGTYSYRLILCHSLMRTLSHSSHLHFTHSLCHALTDAFAYISLSLRLEPRSQDSRTHTNRRRKVCAVYETREERKTLNVLW